MQALDLKTEVEQTGLSASRSTPVVGLNQITIPRRLFEEHLQRLVRHPSRPLDLPASHSRCSDHIELIAARQPAPDAFTLRLALEDRPVFAVDGTLPERCHGFLAVGTASVEGWAWGWLRTAAGDWAGVRRLSLPGAGMFVVPLLRMSEEPASPGSEPSADGSEKWSRTRGAIGQAGYRRATGLRIGMVGLGRLNSILARNLIQFGCRRCALVDPDTVELHNTGEGEFYQEGNVGQLKVRAWESWLRARQPHVEAEVVAESVTHSAAIQALKQCDLIVSAPDQPGARLAASAIASAYCRPLMDVGTMIHGNGPTTMGADVRLVPPDRCLLCLGGVRDEALGRRLLASPDSEREFAATRDWRRERPGSLHSLNQLAASIAMRLFEDYVAGRVTGPVWCHAEFSLHGQITATYPPIDSQPAPGRCACAIAGWADAGPARFLEVLNARSGPA